MKSSALAKIKVYDRLYVLRLRQRNNHGTLVGSTPRQNQESIIMTICLRHDCILTERDERVGVKGHTLVHLLEHDSMWIRAHGAWVEQTPVNMCHSINRMVHRAVYCRLVAFGKFRSFRASTEKSTSGGKFRRERLLRDALNAVAYRR